MEYIGLDYHKQYTVATRLRSNGENDQRRLDNTPQEFDRFFSSDDQISVVFESGPSWPALYELIKDKADHIKMAHPLRVKAIASARIKTDKIDSSILAELLKADLIPEAHLRGEDNRNNLRILRQRAFWVKLRTMVRNRIHSLLDEQPYDIRQTVPQVSRLWGNKGMKWLNGLQLPVRSHQQLLESLLVILGQLDEQIVFTVGMITELYHEDPDAQLLSTIPGLSEFGGVLVSNEIDGIDRFASSKKLVAYAGLVPSTYASGGRLFHGRITKQGSKWLRWFFVQAVSPAVRSDSQLSFYHNRIKRRKGTNAARIATARRLLTIAYHVLKEKRPFVPLGPVQGNTKTWGDDRAAQVRS